MKKLKANVCAVTHSGRVREQNEDNYSLNGRITEDDLRKGSAYVQSMAEPFHLAVCDGMGGESYGDLASHIAVQTIAGHAPRVYESAEDYAAAITGSLEEANERICAEINARGKRMGTTLAAMYAVKGQLLCVNIGDTRLYHYSKGMLEQMSFDHTHAQSIVDAGQASQESIQNIPDAKRLTRHLGVFPEEARLAPNISVIDDVESGDIVLLCSDGLTDMVTDREISAILSDCESAQDAAGKLVRKALENGGKDNVTVIAAFFEVEETAIFAPIAAAMVGDRDADYEDEYRTSYGVNQSFDDQENPVSPYANADARASDPPRDRSKIIKIVVAVAAILAVLALGALVVKAWLDKRGEETETTTAQTTYNFIYTTELTEPTTWVFTTAETTTEESTTGETTTTTTRRATTTRRSTTTTRNRTTSTTRKPAASTTTTRPAATTEPSGTTAPTTASTTAPTSATTQTSSTEPSNTSATEPASASTQPPASSSTPSESASQSESQSQSQSQSSAQSNS